MHLDAVVDQRLDEDIGAGHELRTGTGFIDDGHGQKGLGSRG